MLTYKDRVIKLSKKFGWKFIYKAIKARKHRLDSNRGRHFKPTVVRISPVTINGAVSDFIESKRHNNNISANQIARNYGISKMTLYRHYHDFIRKHLNYQMSLNFKK